MSFVELTRRLSEVRQGEEHLRRQMPVHSEHNRILRLMDILHYTGIPYPWILRQFPGMYRTENIRPREKVVKDKPSDKHEIGERQTLLSRFFWGWDHGTLVKARVGDEWRICNRLASLHPHPAPGAPATPGKVHQLRIDPDTLGLRFK